MVTISATEAQEKFSELLRRVAADKERIVLTRAGEKLVAVVPIEDLALVEQAHRLRTGTARQDEQTVRPSLPALLDKIAAELRDAPALLDEAVSRAGIYADHP